jgi:hypothetical protein
MPVLPVAPVDAPLPLAPVLPVEPGLPVAVAPVEPVLPVAVLLPEEPAPEELEPEFDEPLAGAITPEVAGRMRTPEPQPISAASTHTTINEGKVCVSTAEDLSSRLNIA